MNSIDLQDYDRIKGEVHSIFYSNVELSLSLDDLSGHLGNQASDQ